MYTYAYACVCVCMYVSCMVTSTFIYMYIIYENDYIHITMNICTYICTRIYMMNFSRRKCVCTRKNVYTHMYLYFHVHLVVIGSALACQLTQNPRCYNVTRSRIKPRAYRNDRWNKLFI